MSPTGTFPTRESLDALEERVMVELTRSTTTTSSIRLAADIWNPDGKMGADPIGLMELVLSSLGDKGLVTYRIPTKPSGKRDPYAGFPQDIRLSRIGWALMGFGQLHWQVGSRLGTRQHLGHNGDRTNFRHHSDTAEGGEIERLPYFEHMAKYPTHIHTWTGCPQEENDVMTRGYEPVTDELEIEVLALRTTKPTASYAEIAELAGISERKAKYILVDLPRFRRTAQGEETVAASLKNRIIEMLQMSDFPDVAALRLILGRADTDHDIVHVLHSLHKEGRVDFDEKGPSKEPVRIHLTKRPAQRNQSQKANGAAIPALPIPEPAMHAHDGLGIHLATDAHERTDPWPMLRELREREQARKAQDARGLRFLEAAELLKDTDPETAALLIEKAKETDAPFPSPVESEYLAFAAEFGIE